MVPFSNFVTLVENISPEQLKEIMENGVARVEVVGGQFAQVAGMSVVYDLRGDAQVVTDGVVTSPGTRIQSIILDNGTPIVSAVWWCRGAEREYGHDRLPGRGWRRLPLRRGRIHAAGGNLSAGAAKLYRGRLGGEITEDDYPEGGEGRLIDLSIGLGIEQTIDFQEFGGVELDGAEISAYDPATRRIFVTGSVEDDLTGDDRPIVQIVDVTDPSFPVLVTQIDLIDAGVAELDGGVQSVDVSGGVLAVAISPSDPAVTPGHVSFFQTSSLALLNTVPVGFLPDMVVYSKSGELLLVANEGESDGEDNDPAGPNNPEGSISVIDLSSGVASATVATADFTAFNAQATSLAAAGVRLFPEVFAGDITVAQDLEPEYIALDESTSTARITLQENNAVAVLDYSNPAAPVITAILPLGLKDHSLAGNELDPSDRDGGININNWPVFGMFMPDAIASYQVGGQTYYITANEGDARNEDDRIKDLTLDTTAFPNAGDLQQDEQLGEIAGFHGQWGHRWRWRLRPVVRLWRPQLYDLGLGRRSGVRLGRSNRPDHRRTGPHTVQQ